MFRGNFNPSEKIWIRHLGWFFPRYGKKSHSMVPNHQPGLIPMKSQFSYGFPMKSPFSHGFPMVFPIWSTHPGPPWEPASEASRPRLAGSPMTSIQDGEAPRSPIRSYRPGCKKEHDSWRFSKMWLRFIHYILFYSIILYFNVYINLCI